MTADYTLKMLIPLVEPLPVGTNIGVLHCCWALVSGALLQHRGALIPALQSLGLSPAATRRAWAAFSAPSWQVSQLLAPWRAYVQTLPEWERYEYAGYQPVAVDITAFFRPTLQGCQSQHYHPQAQRALPAITLGLIGEVGQCQGQRLALLRTCVRGATTTPREQPLQTALLETVAQTLTASEVGIFDAGFKLAALHAAGVARYVVRLAKNFTARRRTVAPYGGRGPKPQYGALVRPLARQRQGGQPRPATPPDATATWEVAERTLRAEMWYDLVLPGVVPAADAQVFHVYAVSDPQYPQPWLLASSERLPAATVRLLYQARWPIEQLPLSAKHMVGAVRQFVFAPEAQYRLPELALLMGSVLSVLAATAPARPTGFWDRRPQRTPGRFRRSLQGQPFPTAQPLPPRLRVKASVTAHLPKGVAAHRRTARVVPGAAVT